MSDFQEFLEQALQKTIDAQKYFNNEYSFQIELIVQMRFLTDSKDSGFSGFYVVPEYSNKDDIDNEGVGESGRLDILIRDNEDQFCVIELKHKCKANSWKIPSAKKDKRSSLSLKGGNHDKYKLGFKQIEKDFKRCSNLLDSKVIKEVFIISIFAFSLWPPKL